MIALLCERLRRTTQLVEDSTFLNVAARLAKQLLAQAEYSEPGGRADLVQASQAELAHMLGVSREAVSKQLSLWRGAKVIDLSRGRIVINRRDYLEAFVSLTTNG
jgi:CRP-like cAMP-binding protein